VSGTPTATRTITRSATSSRAVSSSNTFTGTGTGTGTQTITGTPTGTGTGTGTLTQTGTPSFTPTKFQAVAAPITPSTEIPNTTYAVIGSIGGCLVLMTIVAIAILINNRQKRQLHYMPTMMNVPIPQQENPISSRILFAPHHVRGLTTATD
jgi:hypothetical protein